MANRRVTNYIFIHCSATTAKQDWVNAAEIRKWHKAKGWVDIGYHYVIKRDGTLETGRPVGAVGAHCQGMNATSVAVCMVGGADAKGGGENNFTNPQWVELKKIITKLKGMYPRAKVVGHNQYANKACPSFYVPDWYAKEFGPCNP